MVQKLHNLNRQAYKQTHRQMDRHRYTQTDPTAIVTCPYARMVADKKYPIFTKKAVFVRKDKKFYILGLVN